MKPKDNKAEQTPFEAFVEKVAAVPKDVVDQLKPERIKRPKPKRRLKAKKA